MPESAKGKDIVVVLGGYDEQDWNEYWVYWNGHPIGRRTSSGRWRTPGGFAIGPTHALYAAIRLGSPNLLAVRTGGYDLNLENVTQKALDRFAFRPILFDQFVSVGEPFLSLSQFKLRESHQASPEEVRFSLYDEIHHLRVNTHYELDGSVRRKNLTIVNESTEEQLLLDVHMDAFGLDARRTEGGHGDPVFVDDEAFLAIEHPAGINQGLESGIRLWHSPGKKIPAGKTVTTETSVVGVTPRNQLLNRFHEYILSLSPRNKNKRISLYTCYGINNQWGPCAALTDVETLDCQRVIEGWQEKGVKIDYFTIDQGWPDNDGDLTQFAAECYPDGPQQIVDGVKKLNMKFGLWFSVAEEDGPMARIFPSRPVPSQNRETPEILQPHRHAGNIGTDTR